MFAFDFRKFIFTLIQVFAFCSELKNEISFLSYAFSNCYLRFVFLLKLIRSYITSDLN